MDELKNALKEELGFYHADGGQWVSHYVMDAGCDSLRRTMGEDELLECFSDVGGAKARRSAREKLRATRMRRKHIEVTHHGSLLQEKLLIEVRDKLLRSAARAQRAQKPKDRPAITPRSSLRKPEKRDNSK